MLTCFEWHPNVFFMFFCVNNLYFKGVIDGWFREISEKGDPSYYFYLLIFDQLFNEIIKIFQ